jgi:beta-lactamase class A
MRPLAFLFGLLASGCAHRGLEADLRARTRALRGAEVSIAFEDLATGERAFVDADRQFHAASTMKLPVMMEVHRQAAAGRVQLDETLPVDNHFRSVLDDSEFELARENDSDPWTHDQMGHDVPIDKLVERMIVRSSNLATNLIIRRIGADNVTELCRELGAPATFVRRGVEDDKAYRAGIINTTTPRDLMTLLRAIAERRVAGADVMMRVLLAQEFNDAIPAGLPAGTPVAHKTGSFAGHGVLPPHYHDAAIVLPPGRAPYILVVMTRGLPSNEDAAPRVAELSHAVWQHVTGSPPRR